MFVTRCYRQYHILSKPNPLAQIKTPPTPKENKEEENERSIYLCIFGLSTITKFYSEKKKEQL